MTADANIEKVTLYLPSDVVRSLEVARLELLLQDGVKVNRSHIAGTAIRYFIGLLGKGSPEATAEVQGLLRER